MGKWDHRWAHRRRYNNNNNNRRYKDYDYEEPPPSPPSPHHPQANPPLYQDGSGLPWEIDFCKSVHIPWHKVLTAKKFMYCHEIVLAWEDSAGEEAFQNAKRTYWEKINGLSSETHLPDPDMYLDNIDWNSKIDSRLMADIDGIYFNPDEMGHRRKFNTEEENVLNQDHALDPDNGSNNPWEDGSSHKAIGLDGQPVNLGQTDKKIIIMKNEGNPWEQNSPALVGAANNTWHKEHQPNGSTSGWKQDSLASGWKQDGSASNWNQGGSASNWNQGGSASNWNQGGSASNWNQEGSARGGWEQYGSARGGWKQDSSGRGGWNQDGSARGGWKQDGSSRGGWKLGGSASNWNQDGSAVGLKQDGSGRGGWKHDGSGRGGWKHDGSGRGGWNQDGSNRGGWNQDGWKQDGSSRGWKPQNTSGHYQQNSETSWHNNFVSNARAHGNKIWDGKQPTNNFKGSTESDRADQTGYRKRELSSSNSQRYKTSRFQVDRFN